MNNCYQIENHHDVYVNEFLYLTSFLLGPNLSCIPVATITLKTRNKTNLFPILGYSAANLAMFWAKWIETNRKEKRYPKT